MDLRDLISQYRDQILLVGAFVIGLMIMGSIVFFASQDQFLSNYPVTSSTPGQANASSSGPSHLDQDQQELAEDSDANSTPQTETRQQTPALWGTFNISSVLLNGAKWSCQQGRVQLTIPSVQVKADSNRGGDFTWQLEVKNGSGPSSPSSTATVPRYKTTHQLTSGGNEPLYRTQYANDEQAVRVRVTSPNQIASDWFLIPMGTEEKCAQE